MGNEFDIVVDPKITPENQNYFLPRVRFTKTLIRTLSKSNHLARNFLHRRNQQNRLRPIECTELSKFCSKITDYNCKSPFSGSARSSKIICSGMESDSNSGDSGGFIEDTVNDSDIIHSSVSRLQSRRSQTVQLSTDLGVGSYRFSLKKGASSLSNSGYFPEKTDGLELPGESQSWQSKGSLGKKRGSAKWSPRESEILRQTSPQSPTSEYNYESSPKMGHNHAPIESSLFSQNRLGRSKSKVDFFSRQVSEIVTEHRKTIKKSKTVENSRGMGSPRMVIKIRPPEAHELDQVNIHEMIQNRNILENKIFSGRSDLDKMLRNKNFLKIVGSQKHRVNSEMESIREHSTSPGNEAGKNNQSSPSQSGKSRGGNFTTTSLSHFEFQNHNDFQDQLERRSKKEMSESNRTGHGSELSGVPVVVEPKFSDQKEFMSGVGSLNNLTQYIDPPYLNMSRQASRLSRDFQTQDNLSLFRDDKLQYNVEHIPGHPKNMSIEKYFSNIKKNPAHDVATDAKLESIQGPYFTGKDSDPNLGLPPKSSFLVTDRQTTQAFEAQPHSPLEPELIVPGDAIVQVEQNHHVWAQKG